MLLKGHVDEPQSVLRQLLPLGAEALPVGGEQQKVAIGTRPESPDVVATPAMEVGVEAQGTQALFTELLCLGLKAGGLGHPESVSAASGRNAPAYWVTPPPT